MGAFKRLLDLKEEPLVQYGVDVDKEECAASVDCSVVFPEANQLQLDLDSEDAVEEFEGLLEMAERLKLIQIEDYEYSESRSGNTHVTINLMEEITDKDRLLFQLLMGSDRKREMMGMARFKHLGASKSCLFKPNK